MKPLVVVLLCVFFSSLEIHSHSIEFLHYNLIARFWPCVTVVQWSRIFIPFFFPSSNTRKTTYLANPTNDLWQIANIKNNLCSHQERSESEIALTNITWFLNGILLFPKSIDLCNLTIHTQKQFIVTFTWILYRRLTITKNSKKKTNIRIKKK